MNKRYTAMIFIMLFAFTSCKRHDIGITKINIVDGIRRSIKLPLSAISDNILYIPLEIHENSIVAKIVDILFSEDYIIVIDDLPQILLFDKTGKFIHRLGNKEDDKREFLSVYSSIVINKELFIWDVKLNTTFCYDMQTGKCGIYLFSDSNRRKMEFFYEDC
jgi:hypothetical protein